MRVKNCIRQAYRRKFRNQILADANALTSRVFIRALQVGLFPERSFPSIITRRELYTASLESPARLALDLGPVPPSRSPCSWRLPL
jgi:hypothetical protein